MSSPSSRLLQIGIFENNIRRLSTQLQRHILQIALRRILHHLPSHQRTPRERHLFNIHVRRDGVPDGGSVSGDDVDDTRGESDFGNHGGETDGGERGEFGWFHDDGVAACESWAYFP